MYESYWQLDKPPFENGVDSTFYYPSEAHQASLLKLRYTVEQRKGAAVLVGDRGAGKSLLVQLLKQQLPENCRPLVHIVFPQMPAAELLSYIAHELCGEDAGLVRTVEGSVRAIQSKLAANTAAGLHTVLAIDEAHLIESSACWDALRLLLNFQSDGRYDLTLLLIGQLPLLTALERMPTWEDRLAVRCLLKPLTVDEAACYVQHRLHQAGRNEDLFTPEAVTSLHRLSRGYPRRMNRLCDLALVVGYAEQLEHISAAEIDAVSSELTAAPSE